MAVALTRAFGRMALASPATPSCSFTSSLHGQPLQVVRRGIQVSSAQLFPLVVAKQNTLKRQRQAEKARIRNKSRRSAVKTRMKKVFSTIDGMKFDLPKTVEDVAPVSQLISEAYKEIDKAVAKGILHRNTAARRKSRLGRAKTGLMVESGLYTPPPPPAA